MDLNGILKGLNDRQREAISAADGPVLVIAGPGSGKTRALTHHIAYLAASGIRPENILAVTFTNKAAEEMRERVYKLLSSQVDKLPTYSSYKPPFIGTFHSFAAFVLRSEAGKVGYKPNFIIYDDDDSLGLLKEIMKEQNVSPKNFPAPMVAAVISNLKNDLLTADEYQNGAGGEFFPQTVARVYKEYEHRLKLANAFDFDDLIFVLVRLFRQNPEALNRWQDRFPYIHVDEYQDTNASQYELLRLLASKHHNLFVIGDDAQSIYAWRRADYRNIINFERDWPGCRVILLEENYRSTPEIIEAANHIIANNKNQKAKNLWTKNLPGGLPEVKTLTSGRDEALFIASSIAALADDGAPLKEIAVLYRTNAQSRALEEAMIETDMPYVIIGGIRFFARREIKDILAYLRLIENPEDLIARKRIVNVPPRGIGPKTFLSYLAGRAKSLPEREGKKIEDFERLIARLGEERKGKSLSQFLRFLIKAVNYEDYIRDFSPDGESRAENVRELVSVARRYDDLEISDAAAKLLEEIALASEQDQLKENDERVKLMTIHAAKGLEFKAVFVAGLEEGLLPHAKAIQSGGDELEEERRLCYVAMTRAKEKLCLSWAVQRTIFGETQINMPSRFLFELPEKIRASQKLGEEDDETLIISE